MISEELEVSLHMAFVEARAARHEFITVEHLLLSLLDNASTLEVLKAVLPILMHCARICVNSLTKIRPHSLAKARSIPSPH